MTSFFKKLFFISLFCLFVLIPPAIADAEVTCCACNGTEVDCAFSETCSEVTIFRGFACMQGDRTCEATCTTGETNTGITRAGVWSEVSGSRGTTYEKGDTVTCCKCRDSSYACVAVDQTCDSICGTRSYTSNSSNWIRGTTEGVESGDTPATSGSGDKVGLPPPGPQAPNIQITIPGFIGF